jgi:hypothetical protein
MTPEREAEIRAAIADGDYRHDVAMGDLEPEKVITELLKERRALLNALGEVFDDLNDGDNPTLSMHTVSLVRAALFPPKPKPEDV